MSIICTVIFLFGSVLIVLSNQRNEKHRWLVLTSLLIGFGGGGLSRVLGDIILPFIKENQFGDKSFITVLTLFKEILRSLSEYGVPYTLLIYCITYCEDYLYALRRYKLVLKILLFLPVGFYLIRYPVIPTDTTSNLILTIWAALYFAAGNILFVYSIYKEKNPKVKNNLVFILIIMLPATLYGVITSYWVRIFGILDTYKCDIYIVFFEFILAVIISIKYGYGLLRIRIDDSYTKKIIKTLDTGTGIISHTIKNEICKISLCVDNLKIHYPDLNEEAKRSIDIITNSTEHMYNMVRTIKEHMGEIELAESVESIEDLIDKSLNQFATILENRNITVKKEMNCSYDLLLDVVHVEEVLNNVLKNSVDAIGENGEIRIRTIEKHELVVIEIQDNGPGMDKEMLSRIFEPFYTTKKNSSNYGLGLSYCFNVMKKHDGSINVYSSKGKGTSVFLNFPIYRIQRGDYTVPSK